MTCTVSAALDIIRKSADKTENPRYETRINYIYNKYGFYELDREFIEKTLRKDPELMIHEESRTIVSGLTTLLTLQEKELEKSWKKFLDESQN